MGSERSRNPDEVFCRHCGERIKRYAEVCPHCGVRNERHRAGGGQTTTDPDGLGTDGTGLDANVAAAVSYVLGFVSGIAVYVLEDDRFVRFHAAQSITVFGAIAVANVVVSAVFAAIGVGSVAALLSGLVSLVGLGLWVFLIVTAYRGETHRVPVAADAADRLVSGSGGVHRPSSAGSSGSKTGTAADTDALAALRTRYARGDIDEAEFERRLEHLLEAEHTEGERREPADFERSH